MKSRFAPAAVLSLALLASTGLAQPDVIVGDITGPSNYAADATHDAFAMGTTSCNNGTTALTWIANNNQHPVIGYSLYRIHNGRFLHVGQSWLKHGFFALQGTLCGPCNAHPNGSALGVGCSDPYGSGLNGSQSGLGPKYQVNATTGNFPYPPANPGWSGSTARRCRVPLAMLNAPGAQWVSEAQYIQPEDAMANNDDNNASYRMSSVTGGPSNYTLSYIAPTVRELPAIHAWAAADPGVVIQEVQVGGAQGGLFIVASKRTENPNGTYHFEYAVHNLNVHDSAGSFAVNFNGTTISNQGFHSVEWHSGETPNNNAWVAMSAGNGATWQTDQSFNQNANANAIRWGTTYSFWFDSTDPNPTGAVIGLFRSGGSVNVPAPTYPSAPWQTNQPGASLDVNGLTNDPFTGPIQANLLSNTFNFLNVDGAAGQPYEIYLAAAPGIPSLLTTANEQVVNIDFSHPTFAPLGTTTPMPNGGFQIPFQAAPVSLFIATQMVVIDPTNPDGISLSALNEVAMGPAPRVVVECVGSNSFNSNTASGFWRVTHTGVTSANVTSVEFDFSTASGPANGAWFDTDQTGMNGQFNLGGGYRNNSATVAGLNFGVSSPFANSGFIATNGLGGNDYETVEFQFTGGLFNNMTFEFDADTDPGTQSASDTAGLPVTVTLSDNSVLTGTLAVDPQNANRVFVELF